MELSDRVKYLGKQIQKLEEGVYYVEKQVLPRLEMDKTILATLKKDFIAAKAELELLERQKSVKTEVKDEASQG